tara:strand:- start:326 stop:1447 length:1122 start_codon:yes stop_codon:yes gene_type:complete
MKVLVTGGAGFVGSHTVDALVKLGLDVVILDNLQKPVHLAGLPAYINKKATFIEGDVRNKQLLCDILKDVDYIYHFAAYQDYLPDFSTFFHVNSFGTALIYEIIVEKELPVKKIIVASSQFVNGEGIYKDNDGKIYKPYRRTNEQLEKGEWDFTDDNGNKLKWQWTTESYLNPPNQYAISKLSQEQMSINFGERYNIPTVALRYSIIQGSRQSFYNAYSGACRIFSLSYYFDRAPDVYEDGKMKRDFININDVVAANLLVLQNDKANGHVFNVGGGKAISVYDFAVKVSEIFDRKEIKPKLTGKYRFGDTRNACSDISKINEILGWKPKKTIIDSIHEYKNYLINQKDIQNILDFTEKNMNKLNVIRKSKVSK